MVLDGVWGWLKSLLQGKAEGRRETDERSGVAAQPRTREPDVADQPDSLSSEAPTASDLRPLPDAGRPASRTGEQAAPAGTPAPSTKQKPPRPETIDLIIGLDFGTAATKVVVRSPWLPGQRARAVSFEELGHPSSRYLLPTRLRCGDDGSLRLSGNVPGVWMTNLKIALLDRTEPNPSAVQNADPVGAAAAYLALVLGEVRKRFLQVEQEIYRRFEIRWAVNMGIPSDGYNDQSLREEFLRAARVAWQLSWSGGPLTLNQVAEILRQEQ